MTSNYPSLYEYSLTVSRDITCQVGRLALNSKYFNKFRINILGIKIQAYL